jgi:hypothetical protein
MKQNILNLIYNVNIRVYYSDYFETTQIIVTHRYKYVIDDDDNNIPISFTKFLLCIHTSLSAISVQTQ